MIRELHAYNILNEEAKRANLDIPKEYTNLVPADFDITGKLIVYAEDLVVAASVYMYLTGSDLDINCDVSMRSLVYQSASPKLELCNILFVNDSRIFLDHATTKHPVIVAREHNGEKTISIFKQDYHAWCVNKRDSLCAT